MYTLQKSNMFDLVSCIFITFAYCFINLNFQMEMIIWAGEGGCWTKLVAVHQEHVMMINGWSEALGVKLGGKDLALAFVSMAHAPASHPPSVLLLGYALTNWTHTPPASHEVRISDNTTCRLLWENRVRTSPVQQWFVTGGSNRWRSALLSHQHTLLRCIRMWSATSSLVHKFI